MVSPQLCALVEPFHRVKLTDWPNNSGPQGRLDALLGDVDRSIRPLIDAIDVTDLSRYNAAYRAYGVDKFRHFVEAEKRRFVRALTIVTSDRPSGVVCDLGCFVPYLPLAFARLGY